jgi:hypothetical protein
LRVCAVLLVYAVRELRLRLSQVSAVLNAHAEVQLFGYTLFKPTFVNCSVSAGLTSFCCFDQFLLDWPVWLVYPFAGFCIAGFRITGRSFERIFGHFGPQRLIGVAGEKLEVPAQERRLPINPEIIKAF